MSIGPLLFHPLLKHRAWGGHALEEMGKHPPTGTVAPFGESWELADLPDTIQDGRSRIAHGPCAGLTLREALARHGEEIMGRAALAPGGGFPLLIKFLDAEKNLSIQVHPSAAYARRHQGALAKSEAWIVVRARADAAVYRGIDPSLSREDFAALLDTNRVLDGIVRLPVRAGDCITLPSGICHALGAGIVAVEVQTPSDTTFRLWDWGRCDPARSLHRNEALECLLVGSAQQLDQPAVVHADSAPTIDTGTFRTVVLCRTPDFSVEQISTAPSSDLTWLDVVTDGMPVVWVVLEGSICFERTGPGSNSKRHAEDRVRAEAFSTLLLPADASDWKAGIAPETRFLRVTLPDRMSRMLAR